MKNTQFNHDLTQLIIALEKEEALITDIRKKELQQLAQHVERALTEKGNAKVTFICTHNSRRSQLGQLWLKAAAFWLDIPGIFTFSGGTEATAFNHRMVAAVMQAGFQVRKLNDWENPKYLIPVNGEDQTFDIYFSKKYASSYNPQSDFIAIMVCTDADEACPFVPGASVRITLPYKDPKAFDDTPEESLAYDEKVREIGREMLYLVKNIHYGR